MEVTRNAAALTMGIIGIVLGVLGMLIGWIPFIGMLAIPVIVIGGVMALVGLLIAMLKSFQGWGMPVLGTVICGIAFAVTLVIQAASVEVANETIEQTSKAIEQYEAEADKSDTEQPVRTLTPVLKPVAKVDKATWTKGKSVSAIDDVETKYIELKSLNGDATLYFSKSNGRLGACFFIEEVIEGKQVTTRVDKEKAVTADWFIASNYKAALPPSNLNFLASLRNSKKLLVRLDTYLDGITDYSFDLSKLGEALTHIEEGGN